MIQSEKRQKILYSAMELIAEYGFHGAPISDIADRAGVGAGTIYRYFTTKDILITELSQELQGKICTRLQEGYEVYRPLRVRFVHLGTALLRHFIANPLEFRFLEQYHNSPYGVALCRDLRQREGGGWHLYRRLFEEGTAQQIMKDFPLDVFFSLAIGPLLSVASEHILGFIVVDEVLIRWIIEACWDAVKR
jgi:AcrR family transcriptional regulator